MWPNYHFPFEWLVTNIFGQFLTTPYSALSCNVVLYRLCCPSQTVNHMAMENRTVCLRSVITQALSIFRRWIINYCQQDLLKPGVRRKVVGSMSSLVPVSVNNIENLIHCSCRLVVQDTHRTYVVRRSCLQRQHGSMSMGKILCSTDRTLYHLVRILNPVSCLQLKIGDLWVKQRTISCYGGTRVRPRSNFHFSSLETSQED